MEPEVKDPSASALFRSGIETLRRELSCLTGVALHQHTNADSRAELATLRQAIRAAQLSLRQQRKENGSPNSIIEEPAPVIEEEDYRAPDEVVETNPPLPPRRWTPPLKRAMPAPPMLAADKARAALSTHRLGKSARYFVCNASLGPKGGPSEVAEAELARCSRLKRANDAWTATQRKKCNRHRTPSPHSYVVDYDHHESSSIKSSPLPLKAINDKNRRRRRTSNVSKESTSCCALCNGRCWYGCDCECHDGILEDTCSPETLCDLQSVVASDSVDDKKCSAEGLDATQQHNSVDEKKPATVQRRRHLPPLWLTQLLGCEDKKRDFEVTLSAFDNALRRPRGEHDQNENTRVATFLRAVKRKVGTIKKWFEDPKKQDASLSLEGAESWDALEKVVHRTLLAPSSTAHRIRRILDARKERIADLFQSARKKQGAHEVFASVLGAVVAPYLGVLVEEFTEPTVIVQTLKTSTIKRCSCAETCWYGCNCVCHGANKSIVGLEDGMMHENAQLQATTPILQLGERVEVRPLGVMAVYFAGVVACVDEENEEFDVYYDDGRYESGVYLSRLRPYHKQEEKQDEHESSDDEKPHEVHKVPRKKRKDATPTNNTRDEMVRPRVARGGVVQWRSPAEEKKEVIEDVSASKVEISERAIAPRRDVGVYAWSTVDRGLLPQQPVATGRESDEDIPDTPVSLQAGLRPHVPGIAYAGPSTPPLLPTEAQRDADKKAEPGLYDPNWEAMLPRPQNALIVEKKSAVKPRAAVALARNRRNKAEPGVYDIERADGVNSRHSRTKGCSIAPRASNSARPRPEEIMAKLEDMRKRARKRRRAAILAKRAKRRSDAAERKKFRNWRRSKLTTEEIKLASSSSSDDGMSQAERKELAAEMSSSSSDTEARPPQPRVPFTAIMRPEAVPSKLATRKRAENAICEARRGPSAYDVERSLAVVEPKIGVGGATFGAEADARIKNPNTRAAVLLGIKRASEQAAATAREKLLAPQLHHAWASPRNEQQPDVSSEAAYRRSFVRSSKPVFTYLEEAETPDRLRAKRVLELAAQSARDNSIGRVHISKDEARLVDLSVGLGRDSIEILRKDAMRISHFGSPTIRKSIHAPRSPVDDDVEAAKRALEPAGRASVAAFMAPTREELVGPHGERPAAAVEGDERQGDILKLSPHLREEQHGHAFSKADRFVVEKSCSGNEALDLDTVKDSPVKGHRFLRFSNQLNARNDQVLPAAREDETELWLSPRPVEKSATGVVFGRADRFSFEEVEEPKLALSPKADVARRRGDLGVIDYSRQSERWTRTMEELSRTDLKDARSRWILTELERAPRVQEATRAAKGGLQFAVSTSHQRAPNLDVGKQKASTAAASLEGDILDLNPRDGRNSTTVTHPDWSRQSERWMDGDPRESTGDVLKLEPKRPDEIRGYVDWGRDRHESRKIASPLNNENLNPSRAALSTSYRPRNVVDMKRQQRRGEGLHASLKEGDILKLSPSRGQAMIERNTSRSVRFPPHLMERQSHNDVWSLGSPTVPSSLSTAAVQTSEKVLKGDGENLVAAISRLKLAVGSAANSLGE